MRKNLLLIALGVGCIVQAQDSLKTTYLKEVVVTGSKRETPIEKSGKMIFRITGEQLAKSGAGSLADVLNKVPGIQINGNFGTPGTNIDYFVRGAGSKRTLILIDGVPFNDPSGIDLTYDLRLLDMSQIASVEVLRGGLSSLYGSGAAAAVINITLKKAKEGSFNGKAGREVASFKTHQTTLNVNGKLGRVTYLVSEKHFKSEGFSAAKDNIGNGNFDKDGHEGNNVVTKLGYVFSKNFNVEINGALDKFENDFDAFSYSDAPDNSSKYVQKRIGFVGRVSLNKTKFNWSLFRNRLRRRFYGSFPSEYKALNRQANIQLIQQLNSNLSLIAGIDLQKLQYKQPSAKQANFSSTAPYLSGIMEVGNFNLQIGTRVNIHSEYGAHFVYNINPSYFLKVYKSTLKVLANYSTSYITPSLYQLYDLYGNAELTPEESESWDVGASFYGERGLEMNLVYFRRKDTNPIGFRSLFDDAFNFIGGVYFNADGVLRVEGAEYDIAYRLGKFDLRSSYTWLNNLKGELRPQVPRLKRGVGASFNYSNVGSVGLDYSWTGKRGQTDPLTFEQVKTGAYGLLDLVASYQVGKISVRGAVNNLLDKQYDAILGYNTIGRNYRLGVSVDF